MSETAGSILNRRLAVLGVLPREEQVSGGMVLRGHFHGGSAHGQHVRVEAEVLRDDEISSHSRAPEETPRRARTFAGWCGSAL
jgi:hypothetical protein